MSFSDKCRYHDSSYLRGTKLYQNLVELRDRLFSKGYFIMVDSVYAIESFYIPPYDLKNARIPEDDFKFYHSRARITVECEFGETNIRRGIFWKKLACSMNTTTIIIEGAMRLHNLLVEYKDANLPPSDIVT